MQMATCKDCVGYNFCSRKRDGETDYLGKEIGCGNVEDLCGDFKNKADVVPVVRCKHCKFYYCADRKTHLCTHKNNLTLKTALTISREHYCSYGERKCDN